MRPTIDRFAHLDSPIHRWDPRWRIIALAILMLAFALASGPGETLDLRRDLPFALASLAVAIAILQIARIPLSSALWSLRPALIFFAFLWLVMPFTQGGESTGVVSRFSTSGLLAAIVVTLRALSVLLLVFPMFGTSRFDTTMSALRSLRVPRSLVSLTSFSYRFFFVLADQLRRLRLCWRTRGFDGAWNAHTARTVGSGVGMLIVGSMERSDRLWRAMVARGYGGAGLDVDAIPTRGSDVTKALAVGAIALAFLAGSAL